MTEVVGGADPRRARREIRRRGRVPTKQLQHRRMNQSARDAERVSTPLGVREAARGQGPGLVWATQKPQRETADREAGDHRVDSVHPLTHPDGLSLDLVLEAAKELRRRREVSLPEFRPAARQRRPETELGCRIALRNTRKLVRAFQGAVDLGCDDLRVPGRLDDLEQVLRVTDVGAQLTGAFVVFADFRRGIASHEVQRHAQEQTKLQLEPVPIRRFRYTAEQAQGGPSGRDGLPVREALLRARHAEAQIFDRTHMVAAPLEVHGQLGSDLAKTVAGSRLERLADRLMPPPTSALRDLLVD